MEGLLIEIGGFEIFIHQSIVIWLGVLLFVGVLLIYAGSKIKKADPTIAPKGIVLVFEEISNLCIAVIGGNLNKNTWKYLPFMGTMMICMVISNLMGLLGLQSPTSNLSVNLVLAFLVVALIHGTDIKLHGLKGKLDAWCQPMPMLLPLNVIGDLAFPVALTLRLFGNMLGGTIIITLMYMLVQSFMPFTSILFIATPFIHMYFDVFAAFMQTYIFFMLGSFFLAVSCEHE